MNKKLSWFAAAALAMSGSAFAHDEGHGPKLTDVGLQGGVVAPVVDAQAKGHHVPVMYKSELVRNEDGTMKLYVYDKKMQPLASAGFEKTAKAVMIGSGKKKGAKVPFDMNWEGDAFVGKGGKEPSKPFTLEVTIKEGAKIYLSAYQNLD